MITFCDGLISARKSYSSMGKRYSCVMPSCSISSVRAVLLIDTSTILYASDISVMPENFSFAFWNTARPWHASHSFMILAHTFSSLSSGLSRLIMRKHGIPTKYDILLDICKMLAEHIDESRQQYRRQASELPRFPKCKTISKRIKSLWHKIPDGWYKNPYAWTGIGAILVFVTLFVISWMQWHRYREENIRLRIAMDKHRVAISIVRELHPSLAVTVGAYEELTEQVGADSTLAVFRRQVEKVRNNETNSKQ